MATTAITDSAVRMRARFTALFFLTHPLPTTPRIDRISSPANPLFRDIRRAVWRGEAVSGGLWVAEGFHLLEEALRSERPTPTVICVESALNAVQEMVGGMESVRVAVIPDDLFGTLSSTEASQGVITLVQPAAWNLDQVFRGNSLVLILDALQDPGNAGATVRAAEAFGATGMIFMKGTVSPANPKTLRASAGSLFRMPFVAGLDGARTVAACQQYDTAIHAAVPWTGTERTAAQANFTLRAAIAIGSEGRGLSEVLQNAAQPVAIPTSGVESLNAAVAASILLYEARRGRSAV